MTGKVDLSTGSWRTRVSYLALTLLDTLLPPACASCGKAAPLICDECRARIAPVEEPLCWRCGRPTLAQAAECGGCRGKFMPLQQVRAAVFFQEPVREIIHKLKYQGMYALAEPLAKLMAERWPAWEREPTMIVPIPLHPSRERSRGFNQAELLANHVGKAVKLRCVPAALRRLRQTRPQIDLSPAERQENVAGAFRADVGEVAGQRVLLVDDVFTTGSTMSEAARAAIDAGARSVSGYCLARPK